jgi:DNA-binding NtrC family response regulator
MVPLKSTSASTSHDWPGNVRELKNTISRCCYKSTGNIIHEEVVRDAFIQIELPSAEDILGREFSDNFNINELIKEVERHYIVKAIEKGKNQKNAAKLLGLKRETYRLWLERHGLI